MADQQLPELPPGYCWIKDAGDWDIVKASKAPPDYKRGGRAKLLVAWVTSCGIVYERSITKDKHTYVQKTGLQSEGMPIAAMRLWLGMNEP